MFEVYERGREAPKEATNFKALEHNIYKINFDGALFENQNTGGIGVVFRDGRENFKTAVKRREQFVSESYEVEALSTCFAEELGQQHIILEGNCLRVIQALHMISPDPMGHLIEEVNDRLRYFQSTKISHTEREGNIVAHLIARSAAEGDSPVYWIEDPPSFIMDQLNVDVTATF
ncbi:hypothetical protein AAC387_Pa10g1336 [Persea americana]